MTAHNVSLAFTIILLLPMSYFLLTTPTFLLASLDDPTVTRLLRGVINVQFALIGLAGAVAATAFATSGRPVIGLLIGAIAVLAFSARRWLLHRVDAQIRARDAGDPEAVRRLRRLHWSGMLYNAAQFVAIIASIPFVFAAA